VSFRKDVTQGQVKKILWRQQNCLITFPAHNLFHDTELWASASYYLEHVIFGALWHQTVALIFETSIRARSPKFVNKQKFSAKSA